MSTPGRGRRAPSPRRAVSARCGWPRPRSGDGYRSIPPRDAWEVPPGAAYLHYVANETIAGVEFGAVPDAGEVPLVCDMSSNILSRPIDVGRFGVIYAGAQKNMGVSGLTAVIVREDLLERAHPLTPTVIRYRAQGRLRFHGQYAVHVRVVRRFPGARVDRGGGRGSRPWPIGTNARPGGSIGR